MSVGACVSWGRKFGVVNEEERNLGSKPQHCISPNASSGLSAIARILLGNWECDYHVMHV